MRKIMMMIIALLALLVFTGCQEFDLNSILGGSSNAKFTIETEDLGNNKAKIKVELKNAKVADDFETFEEYIEYMVKSVESLQKKLLKDEELKGNEEVIADSITQLTEQISSATTEEEVLSKITEWFIEVDKTYFIEFTKLREPYVMLVTNLLLDADKFANEQEEVKDEIVKKVSELSSEIEKDLTEEELKEYAVTVIKYIEEAKVLDYFIESIAEFLVDAKIFKVSGNAFANGNFNYDLLKDNGEEKKEYKERVCDVILELAYETKNSILQDEAKLDAYAANLAEFAYKLLNSEDVQSLYNDLVKIAENFENLRK